MGQDVGIHLMVGTYMVIVDLVKKVDVGTVDQHLMVLVLYHLLEVMNIRRRG